MEFGAQILFWGIVLSSMLVYALLLFAKLKRRAKKSKSLVKLLIAKIRKENIENLKNRFDDDTSSELDPSFLIYISPDEKVIGVKLNRGVYKGEELPEGQRLTLEDAYYIDPNHKQFIDELMDTRDAWPQGVEYSYNEDGEQSYINISMYVEINYKGKPLEDLDGYFDYALELQQDIALRYNQFRERFRS